MNKIHLVIGFTLGVYMEDIVKFFEARRKEKQVVKTAEQIQQEFIDARKKAMDDES